MKQQTLSSNVNVSGQQRSHGETCERVFRRIDWLVFGVVFIVSLVVYFFTLAPTVTLEDSGELVVAADYLGVPHPPGYPLWTIMAWVFQWIFHWVRYLGNPNPAWGVNFMSAFFSSLCCANVALLVSRSGSDLLRFRRQANNEPAMLVENIITGTAGISAGLLLAFSPILWSQSVIAEVYSLNAFIHIFLLTLAYMWMCRPQDNRLLYGMAVTFGIGITNCQPIGLIVLALMLIVFVTDRPLFRDSVSLGLVLLAGYLFMFKVRQPSLAHGGQTTLREQLWLVASFVMLLTPAGIWFVTRDLFTEWKRVLLMFFFLCLGVSLLLYMPIASDFNPPMNWGYPRTWEGFKHAITRGQYQALSPAFKPMAFIKQAVMYFRELEDQFTLPVVLLALVPVFYLRRIRRKDMVWLGATAIAFVFTGIVLLALMNPAHDIQSMFIARVQMVHSIAIYALWIGYGFILGLAFIESVTKAKVVLAIAALLVLSSPLVLIWKNARDQELIRSYGCSNMNGHDFGWQFGNYQLRGANAIKEEQQPGEPPLPNPDYPPEMEQNAIFYGGTDPGRFVPTYMIYSAKVRPDVFLITQNALADNTYMNVMRDLYGDLIWIPTPQDTNLAFQKYVKDVQEGRIPRNAAVNIDKSGRVSVQGVQGVMEINGIISKAIFEANKNKHAFFVEESYVIRWMYPYLEPHGLIMKINKEPFPKLTDEMIKNDMEFWNWYNNRLLNNENFRRDAVARKTFSKLRCAIAGLYAYRRLFNEAEAAFRQAIDLFPISPEANFRLADIYLQQGRFADAYAVMEKNLQQDQRNDKIKGFLEQIKNLEQTNTRMTQLQALLSKGGGSLDMVFELIEIYRKTGRQQLFYDLTRQVVNNTNIPLQAYLKVIDLYTTCSPRPLDLMADVFQKYLKREPANPRIWLELSCIQADLSQNTNAMKSLRQAVVLGGEPIKEAARKDQRLAPLRSNTEFQKLVAPTQRKLSPFPRGFIK